MGITLASHLEQTLPLQKFKIKRMVKNSIKPVVGMKFNHSKFFYANGSRASLAHLKLLEIDFEA